MNGVWLHPQGEIIVLNFVQVLYLCLCLIRAQKIGKPGLVSALMLTCLYRGPRTSTRENLVNPTQAKLGSAPTYSSWESAQPCATFWSRFWDLGAEFVIGQSMLPLENAGAPNLNRIVRMFGKFRRFGHDPPEIPEWCLQAWYKPSQPHV